MIRQEDGAIVSHPFPQKAQERMGHPDSAASQTSSTACGESANAMKTLPQG
jgi:hypothetical protein